MIKIKYIINRKADKLFEKHSDIEIKFKENMRDFYDNKTKNLDIKPMKGFKELLRMRIGSYRVIYKVENQEIIIVSVIAAGSRGDIYK